MTDMAELKELARILDVDLSADPDVQLAYDQEHAEYVGTGLRQVRPEPYRNVWGDDPNDYSEEFCRECARLLPGHYNNCSPEGRTAANAAVSDNPAQFD